MLGNRCKIEIKFICKNINNKIMECKYFEKDITRFAYDREFCIYEKNGNECRCKEANKEAINYFIDKKEE